MELLGNAVGVLEAGMRFRVARQGVLAANLANADTPGYRRSDLHFDAALDDALRLARSDARHLTSAGTVEGGYRLETGRRDPRPDRNGVDLEREIVTLSRNAGAFKNQAAAMSRLLVIARIAITGEAR